MSKHELPYYGSPEDVEKMVEFLRNKPVGASAQDVKRTLGQKHADNRKYDLYAFYDLFTVENSVFKLTRDGMRYTNMGSAHRQGLLCQRIRTYTPYMALLEYAYHSGYMELDGDAAAHYWATEMADSLDLSNKERLRVGPGTFFAVCQAAGLGTYYVGRRGSKTRIEFDHARLAEFIQGNPAPEAVEAPEIDEGVTNGIPGAPKSALAPVAAAPENVVHVLQIPVRGKVLRIYWDEPTMSADDWEKLKKIGDAMFLD